MTAGAGPYGHTLVVTKHDRLCPNLDFLGYQSLALAETALAILFPGTACAVHLRTDNRDLVLGAEFDLLLGQIPRRTDPDYHIAGAGLDVFEHEPVDCGDPLLTLDNVIVIPHIASASVATRTRMAVMAAENLITGLKGEPLPNEVVG